MVNRHVLAAAEELESERQEMISAAKVLRTRLDALINNGHERMSMELPTILRMLSGLHDSIMLYRQAKAVHSVLLQVEKQDA